MSDLDDEIQRVAAGYVAAGIDSYSSIVESMTEQMEDDHDEPGMQERVERIVQTLFIEHLKMQAYWPALTDCDRLDKAFNALEMNGIIARQNFSCCQNCGHAEIGDEIEEHCKIGPVKGYVFYHMQDTEGAVENGSLFLAYGATERDIEKTLQVAREIQTTLTEQGLSVDWNGSVEKRISVQLDWKRRRPENWMD